MLLYKACDDWLFGKVDKSMAIVNIDLSSRALETNNHSDAASAHYSTSSLPAHQQSSFLSPYPSPSIGRLSLDVPRSLSPSPTFLSSYEGSNVGIPPSPTLSTQSSVQFATYLNLRNNKPEDLTSFELLHHSTLDSHGSKPDHHGDGDPVLHRAKSDAARGLTVASPSAYFEPHSRESTHSESEDNVHTTRHPPVNIPLELRGSSAPDKGHADGTSDTMSSNDGDIDLGPFAFKPHKLASLVDLKDLHSLEAIGGVESLLRGLGTHPTQGLWVGTYDYGGGRSTYPRPSAGAGASQRCDQPSVTKQGSVESKAVSSIAGPGDDRGDEDDPFCATPQERKRVFGENLLPHPQTKPLLALMWLVPKDKVPNLNLIPRRHRTRLLATNASSALPSNAGSDMSGVQGMPGAEEDAPVRRSSYLQQAAHSPGPWMPTTPSGQSHSAPSLQPSTLSIKDGQCHKGVISSTSPEVDESGVTLNDAKEISKPGMPLKDTLFIPSSNINTWQSGPADAEVPNSDCEYSEPLFIGVTSHNIILRAYL